MDAEGTSITCTNIAFSPVEQIKTILKKKIDKQSTDNNLFTEIKFKLVTK